MMMKPATRLLLIVTTMLAVVTKSQEQDGGVVVPEPNCGDCWCKPNEGEECPELGQDYHYYPKPEWAVFNTFKLVDEQEPLKLVAEDGSGDENCSPFATLTDIKYDENLFPSCVVSPPQVGNYCGYKYPNGSHQNDNSTQEEEDCQGRDYQMITYDTLEAMAEDGAQLIHRGACGVCSNAQDVWNKMDVLDSVSTRMTFCAVNYITSQNFKEAHQCIMDIGWTESCAFIWAHYSIANAIKCSSVCMPNRNNEIEGNGPAPDCQYSDCIQCSQGQMDDINYNLTGYSGMKGGVVDRTITHPCSLFTPVQYDPCVGAKKPTTTDFSDLEETSKESGAHETLLAWSTLLFFWTALPLLV